ncbi:SpaA isopeptide-forming pilin-related protein [Enterococcus viikkiensis]|uniref:SpaA isopeptide-forming pilin-related protein n=1 Tax=Enterococcus viikkiensis TaxID=930854 RepID=A0ABU3FR19_9ENTE|nr:SpaA isopeptide-forming pilin-related protein [Enterococcus viikkiensis]MDT2828361.1 SpaA isopeptide-forming pilin-related protein [Enterococcus viikkiensis]
MKQLLGIGFLVMTCGIILIAPLLGFGTNYSSGSQVKLAKAKVISNKSTLTLDAGNIQSNTAKVLINRLEQGLPKGKSGIQTFDKTTGEALPGAVYRLTDAEGNKTERRTNQKGQLILTDLAKQYYTVEQLKAPAGYYTNSQPQAMDLTNEQHVTFFNQRKKDTVIVTVRDIEKGTVLPKTSFILTQDSKRIAEPQSDVDGRIVLANLTIGTYKLIQTKATADYEVNPSKITFTVREADNE